MTSNLNTMTDGTHRMHVKMIGEMDVDPEEALYVVRTQTFAHHPDETVSFGDRDADTVQLHLDDTPATTLYAGSKVVEMPRGMALECSMRDLRQPLAWRADHRLDMLSFDIPSKALTRWARDNGVRSVGGLSFQDGVRQHDEVIKGFGLALLPFLDDPAFAPRLFVDCVLNAVCSHLVRRFGTTYNMDSCRSRHLPVSAEFPCPILSKHSGNPSEKRRINGCCSDGSNARWNCSEKRIWL